MDTSFSSLLSEGLLQILKIAFSTHEEGFWTDHEKTPMVVGVAGFHTKKRFSTWPREAHEGARPTAKHFQKARFRGKIRLQLNAISNLLILWNRFAQSQLHQYQMEPMTICNISFTSSYVAFTFVQNAPWIRTRFATGYLCRICPLNIGIYLMNVEILNSHMHGIVETQSSNTVAATI
jgi:hypothetical protein